VVRVVSERRCLCGEGGIVDVPRKDVELEEGHSPRGGRQSHHHNSKHVQDRARLHLHNIGTGLRISSFIILSQL
jgi:hypothetical protein